MTINEKVAYIKGLADGLAIGADTKEGKLLLAIVDLLGDMAEEVDALGENALDIGDEIDALSDDLADIEEIIFGDDDDDDDDDCDCCCDDDDCDCDDDDCDCCGGDGDLIYEVDCPACGEEITLDETILDDGEILCPKCGEKLEFVFDDDEDEDDAEGDDEE